MNLHLRKFRPYSSRLLSSRVRSRVILSKLIISQQGLRQWNLPGIEN